MRAAVVSAYADGIEVADRDDPRPAPGEALVELAAVALNPADVAVASGTFWAGSPPLPYVPGIEGVGRVAESERLPAGTRVYACGAGLGVARDGTLAERFAVPDDVLVEVPDGLDDPLAVALGTVGLAAWLPLTWAGETTPEDSVLVLGATGSVGSVAVQAARALGVRRVVGVGRDEERLARAQRYGCDAVVQLGDDFAERLAEATADDPPTVIVDTLWGGPAEAAFAVAARGARFLHVGQSASPTATVSSALVRGRQLRIVGYSNFAVPRDVFARGYHELLGHAAEGRIEVELDVLPLADAPAAWSRQVAGDGLKLVVVP